MVFPDLSEGEPHLLLLIKELQMMQSKKMTGREKKKGVVHQDLEFLSVNITLISDKQ
jgi:hypothetical protein